MSFRRLENRARAEDLTQDIFLKIFRALHTFDRRANFQTWLISISRNLCIDHYRSVRKERETMALRFIEQWEYHEIAAAKAIPIGTVQWRVFNSKKKLAAHLSPVRNLERKAA